MPQNTCRKEKYKNYNRQKFYEKQEESTVKENMMNENNMEENMEESMENNMDEQPMEEEVKNLEIQIKNFSKKTKKRKRVNTEV